MYCLYLFFFVAIANSMYMKGFYLLTRNARPPKNLITQKESKCNSTCQHLSQRLHLVRMNSGWSQLLLSEGQQGKTVWCEVVWYRRGRGDEGAAVGWKSPLTLTGIFESIWEQKMNFTFKLAPHRRARKQRAAVIYLLVCFIPWRSPHAVACKQTSYYHIKY